MVGYPLKFDTLQSFMIPVADDIKLDKRLQLGATHGFIQEVPCCKDHNMPTDSRLCNESKLIALRLKLTDLEMVFLRANQHHDEYSHTKVKLTKLQHTMMSFSSRDGIDRHESSFRRLRDTRSRGAKGKQCLQGLVIRRSREAPGWAEAMEDWL